MATPNYTLPEAARITGVPLNTLSTWVGRGFLPSQSDDVGGGQRGVARRISSYSVVAIAIMHQLTKLGLPLDEAREAAMKFAYFGDDSRPPAKLFPDGETYLVVYPKSASTEDRGRVTIANITSDGFSRDIITNAIPYHSGHAHNVRGLVLLQLDHLILGMTPVLGSDD